MTPRTSSAVGAIALLVVGLVRIGAAGPKGTSVWTGVYSTAQADRGAAIFKTECASCHGADLRGGDQAPELAGPIFMANWTGQTVGALLEKITKTMPKSTPGKLNRQQYLDVIACVLRANKAPAGASDLPSAQDDLDALQIDDAPGSASADGN